MYVPGKQRGKSIQGKSFGRMRRKGYSTWDSVTLSGICKEFAYLEYKGAEKVSGNWCSWKEVRGHLWHVGVVCSKFIYDLSATLDISIWWWLLWWVFLFYCSSDIMAFLFSWSTMARNLSSLWAMHGEPLKDFRWRWDMTRIALSAARWLTDWIEQDWRHRALTVNTWNILSNRSWI